VRSAVRENALWSAVILCAQGAAVLRSNGGGPTLRRAVSSLVLVVRSDQNIICVGFAMDCLHRLSSSIGAEEAAADPLFAAVVETAESVIREAPMRSWESLCRSGKMDAATVAALVPEDQIEL
jgi:hypothetical protein